MSEKRKILAVTGARSEYDIISPVLDRLRKDSFFEVSVLVTGSHLSENFGKTVKNIERDGFTIADKVYNLINTDEKIGRVISLGYQIPGFAQSFARIKPDIILVVGDREEAISVTLTGAYMDIAVAHFSGGDVAKDGNIDNSVRYAASKFAHIHFPVLSQHRETLLKLGEDDWRIFTVGNPALDKFISTPHLTREEVSSRLNFKLGSDPYILLIQHPIISQAELEGQNIRKTLDAIIETNLKCLINYPNSDAGNHYIIEAYQEYSKKYPQLFLFKNLDRETYVNVLRHAACLVGNSSSGLTEAPSLGLPVVNVGLRQRGRFAGNNVIFVDNDQRQIKDALIKSLYDENYRTTVKAGKNPYGDGNSAEKIVDVLKKIKIDSKLLYKNITY
jgi:GDP/UDP-N,N'-diacetylbacillosamine 2-epimerase (hydrolysing)